VDRLVSRSNANHIERGTWRCDPHPAWSRDGRWIAMNAYDPSFHTKSLTGASAELHRQVLIAYASDVMSSAICTVT
jgi:hypothetical protein